MSLKSFESNNYPVPHLAEEKIEWSECSFIFWENIIGESESYTSLLLGGNNYLLNVAEKFECSECRHKVYATVTLGKYHR